MKNSTIFRYFIVLCIPISVFFLTLSLHTPHKETVQAKDGVLDLRSWNASVNPTTRLEGEFLFYWKRLLTTSNLDKSDDRAGSKLVYFPSWWNIAQKGYTHFPNTGYGTYRVKVMLPKSMLGERLAISTKESCSTAFKFFINSTPLMSRGEVVTRREDFKINFLTKTAFFEVKDTEFELIIQVASYNDRNSGLAHSIYLGSEQAIIAHDRNRLALDMVVFGILLVLALHHFALYFLRQNDRSPLYFSIFCICFAIRTLSQGSNFIFILFPFVSHEVYIKIGYITYYYAVPIFLSFFYKLFPHDFKEHFVKISHAFSAVFVLIVLVTPLQVYSTMLNAYHVFFLIVTAYLSYSAFIIVKKRRMGAEAMAAGILTILIFPINDILHNMGIIHTQYIVTYGFMFFVLTQTYLLSHRFSAAFVKVELLSENLKTMNESLQRLDKMKDEFLANTSHELRTPLNGIIGIAESIFESKSDNVSSSTQENLNLIIASARRLTNLVNDLLDFSKIKNLDITLSKKTTDIKMITDIVLEHFKHLKQAEDVTIINKVPDDLPAIFLDEDRIQQVLFNLVGNAVKFTHKGCIEITSLVETINDKKLLTILVKDSGIGIDEDHLSKIFEPFEQADGSIGREYGGTGLGLSISKMIVELHGGSINVSSKRGEGSTFTIHLPYAEAEKEKSKKQADSIEQISKLSDEETDTTTPLTALEKAENGKENNSAEVNTDALDNTIVMVVDDDPINIRVLENHLSSKQVKVLTAFNGFDALSSIESGTVPDLILLDIMMPRMSGYEVARKIREKYPLFDIPIIMLTAKDKVQDIITGFQCGANDYMRKPFNRYELLARINTHLSLKKAMIEKERLISIEEDIEIAKKIQANTLSTTLPVSDKFSIAARYVPMKGIGGDFYGIHELQNGNLGILLADVNGHGIHAALIASMIKIIFTTLEPIGNSPLEFLNQLNRIIMRNTEQSYLTASYITLNVNEMTVNYSRAGHEPIVIHRRATGELIRPEIKGRMIGMRQEVNFEELTISLISGDRVILLTDGIIESMNEHKELFGQENLDRVISENKDMSSDEFVDTLIETLVEWTGKKESFYDDVTIVVVDVS